MTRRVLIVSTVYLMLLALTQSVVSQFVHLPYHVPDYLLFLPVLAGIWYGQRYAFWIGLAAGLFRDVLAGRILGMGSLIGMFIGLLAAALNHDDRRFRWLFTLLSVPVVTILHTALMTALKFILPVVPLPESACETLFWLTIEKLPYAILVNIAAAVFVLLLFFLLPLVRRKRKRHLGLDASGGVEHDVFNLDQ